MEELKNNFLNVIKSNYANFNGRARRREFWMFNLAVLIVFIAIIILTSILSMIADFLGLIGLALYLVAGLGIIVPSIALIVRRMHDVGKSGWFFLIPIYSFILTITEGEKGSNSYGEDPKA